MPRKLSRIAPDWWDYTTLNDDILRDAAALTHRQMERLARPGFRVVMYDTLEDFYLAEALEYIDAWKQSTPDTETVEFLEGVVRQNRGKFQYLIKTGTGAGRFGVVEDIVHRLPCPQNEMRPRSGEPAGRK